MGFRKDAYATVWKVEFVSPTLTRGQISVNRKNKDGEYEQDFGAFVAFIGTRAAEKALRLKEKDHIRLGDVDVSTKYDKEKNTTYTNYKIFSFESPEELGAKTTNAKPAVEAKAEPEVEIDDSNLPF